MDCICGPLLFRLLISSVSIAVIQNWAIKCVCRVTTCLENVEMSENLIKMLGNDQKSGICEGKLTSHLGQQQCLVA